MKGHTGPPVRKTRCPSCKGGGGWWETVHATLACCPRHGQIPVNGEVRGKRCTDCGGSGFRPGMVIPL